MAEPQADSVSGSATVGCALQSVLALPYDWARCSDSRGPSRTSLIVAVDPPVPPQPTAILGDMNSYTSPDRELWAGPVWAGCFE